ncbi:hypothetical protein N7494_008290 [Penicillium frequentans]|uniref:Uncharacterized protein n=1 Tax=Penicillium frequentans TaxID=3151616 RepID=A0AAD6GFJ9_9EURO|nr:hypothetical protein N7494_008290 [Penicillium glabrum]
MPLTASITATQKVFLIPELVAEILYWLAGTLRDAPHLRNWWANNHSRHHLAAQYITINRVFFSESVRLLGKIPLNTLHPQRKSHNLPLLPRFEIITSRDRAQFYADSLEQARITSVRHSKIRKANATFKGITFPKLQQLELKINNYVRSVNIPIMRCPALKSLGIIFDEYADPWTARNDDLSYRNAVRMAKWIKASFPELKSVLFQANIPTSALKTLSEHLPSVKVERLWQDNRSIRQPDAPLVFGIRVPRWAYRLVRYHTAL